MERCIYLDNAATTKPKQEVIDAMLPYLTEKWHNPSSLYGNAVAVKKDIEIARKTIADFINAEPEEIYFTSGASESNSWAIQGFVRKHRNPCIITSNIEHKSINSCIGGISSYDCDCTYIDVDRNGLIELDVLDDALSWYSSGNNNILTSIQFANSEIGTIQNIKEISCVAHKHDSIFHTDATQAFGKIPIDVKELDIDMMSVSGHKIGCPRGIGFLYIKNGIKISPLIYGVQENGMRGGTENVAGIIGFAKAVELCKRCLAFGLLEVQYSIRNTFIDILKNDFGCRLNGYEENRLGNNINVTFPDVTGESLLYTLDLNNVAISTGSACDSKRSNPSYVLKAIGLSDDEAMRTIRITLPDILDYNLYEYMDMLNTFVREVARSIELIKLEGGEQFVFEDEE